MDEEDRPAVELIISRRLALLTRSIALEPAPLFAAGILGKGRLSGVDEGGGCIGRGGRSAAASLFELGMVGERPLRVVADEEDAADRGNDLAEFFLSSLTVLVAAPRKWADESDSLARKRGTGIVACESD